MKVDTRFGDLNEVLDNFMGRIFELEKLKKDFYTAKLEVLGLKKIVEHIGADKISDEDLRAIKKASIDEINKIYPEAEFKMN